MRFSLLRKYLLVVFILLSQSSFSAETSDVNADTWQINHQGIDIQSFIKEVSLIIGKTFIVDPQVKGSISVISEEHLTKKGILELFYSVLSVHGYVAVETNNAIKIVPQNKAKQNGLRFDDKNSGNIGVVVTKIIPIKNAIASALVPVIRPLIPSYGHLANVSEMNALIVSDHAENIAELERLITKLDNTSDSIIRVIVLENAWASDVLDSLNAINGGDGGSPSASNTKSASISVIADERTNRLILKGKEAGVIAAVELIKELDEPSLRASRLHIIPLRYADATVTAELIQSVLTTTSEGSQATLIKADVSMNQLIVNADPSVLNDLKPIIDVMDVPRAQIMVEAIIAEINMDDANSVGIQWLITDGSGVLGGSNFTNSGSSLSNIATSVAAGTETLATGGTIGGVLTDSGISLGSILQAVTTNSAANLLSTPKIVTLDNQEASMLVGETRPFETGSYSDTTGNPFTTTTRHDIGLSLVVTPHINAGGQITLTVNQTVEAASTEESDAGVITTKREFQSVVVAEDGETISLGGLMKDDVRIVHQKVPLLGDIPFLGALFRSTSMASSKQNLVVFLRPTILRNKTDVRAEVERSYRTFKSIEMNSIIGPIRPVSIDDLLN